MDARSILYNIINGSKVINFMAKLFAGRERISSFIRRRNTVHEKFPDLDLDRVRLDVATLCQLDCNLHDASKINMEIVHPKVMVLYLGAES